MKVALTGGIACGKSLLSQYLNELGVETLDADDVVHGLIPDPAERRRIAAEVFADPGKRRALEAKIHPVVKSRIDEWFADERREKRDEPPHVSRLTSRAPGKIAVIPLLFEAHWEGNFDIICCVASSRENQIERMTATRAMTLCEAEARLAAQLPVEEKAARSHYVIRNDGTPEELKSRAEAFLAWLKERNPHGR